MRGGKESRACGDGYRSEYLDKGSVALYTGLFDSSLGFGEFRDGEIWSTPDGWFDEGSNSNQIQEGYQLVLNSDGTVFHWLYCEDGDDCDEWDR